MRKIKISIILLTLSTIIFSGCLKKDYLDVNTDPNRANDNNITPELLFPQAANAAGTLLKPSGSNYASFLYNWVGYYSTPGDYALPGSQTTYELTAPYTEALWNNYYNTLFDLFLVQQKALAKGDSVLAGAAMVLSAKAWQELVDMFGNIPFSEAFQNSTTRTPKYDKDADIYAALQKMLDDAISNLKHSPHSSFNSIDIVNHGSTSLWIKFANTIKLRLLIHQSEVQGLNPSGEIAKITANGGVVHESDISVNPGYSNDAGKQNPYYGSWGFTPTGADAIPSERANAYIVNILQSTSDPRLTSFFSPVGSTVVGVVYGLTNGNPFGAQSSKPGPGLLKTPTADLWIMPAFESMFLEAEAIARGWIPGDPKTAYENAVRESFVWLGVPDAINTANAYLSGTAIADWANAGSTPQSMAKFIAYQKYIALTGIDPLEAWVDIRRLNMLPNNGYISANPAKVSTHLPYRLPYPQSEYNSNTSSVQAQGSNDILTHKIFWQP
ncbi:MAG: SusD/RagB family nutrient-binding outer membrane lipoprotein [Flavisolibacter sp.]